MSLNALRTEFLQWHGFLHCLKHSNLSFPNSEPPQEESMMCKICNFHGQAIKSSSSTELDMTKNFTSTLLEAERVAAVSAKGRTSLLQHQ
jgi:hypothetical protein